MRPGGPDTWIALDFETATSARASACALGIAIIEGDAVTRTQHWLIRPPGNLYDPMNTRIHGIRPEQTADEPSFAELYPELLPYLEGRYAIAHNASFDMSVLRASLRLDGLPTPGLRYICSCTLARRVYPGLDNHRLPTVCDRCGIPLKHHDAASDAFACAHIALECAKEVGARSVSEAVRHLDIKVGVL